jgi:transposase
MLNDDQWQSLEPLLPKQAFKRGGRPRADNRQTLEGILWVLKNGANWSKLPLEYGAYVTVWRRFREWEQDGTWAKVWLRLLNRMSRREQLDWMLAFADGHFVPGKNGNS